MKTPREILFARHQANSPKLDGIRRAVVGELQKQESRGQSFVNVTMVSLLHFSSKIWQELILPCRRIWLGFAAVWVCLFVVNFAQRDSSQGPVANALPSAGMMMAYRDQQKMLEELLAETPTSRPVMENRQRNAISKPRSEIIEMITI